MSRGRSTASCVDVAFATPCVLDAPAQVALEDYARVLTIAAAAEVVEAAPGLVGGVHLCGLSGGITVAAQSDILDFARELSTAVPGGGLGWS